MCPDTAPNVQKYSEQLREKIYATHPPRRHVYELGRNLHYDLSEHSPPNTILAIPYSGRAIIG